MGSPGRKTEDARPGFADQVRAFGRYARRLRPFLRQTLTVERAREMIARQLDRRGESFLALLERGVYGNPASPYRPLLDAAGIELGDVRRLIGDRGLEGALAELREAGVHATLEEFKGRVPLERGTVALEVDHHDFDNPALAGQWGGRSSGSRGPRRRVPLDLDLLGHDAAHEALFREGFGLWGRPFAIWRVRPPSTAGINNP